MPLHCLIEREVELPCLTHLTWRGFVAREPTLERLFSLPRLRSIGIACVSLVGDGCWIRIMTALRMRKCAEVHLSGWVTNDATTSGWYGDNSVFGSIYPVSHESAKGIRLYKMYPYSHYTRRHVTSFNQSTNLLTLI
jgi:hypothetical protein